MTITVEVPDTFSGPLDLLLYLVRRDEIDLHAIPLARLTRAYLAEIETRGLIDVDNGGEFLAMATTLLEMKSRGLLPAAPDRENPEDPDGETLLDPRQGLVKALLAYKGFKQAANELGGLAATHAERFARQLAADFPTAALEPEIRSAWELFAAFQKIARKLIADQRRREIVNEEISTEVRIAQIETALLQKARVAFTDLLSAKPNRDELVGFFIAILELVRLKKVIARQAVDFSEIYLHARTAAASNEVETAAAQNSARKTPRIAAIFAPILSPQIFANLAPRKKLPLAAIFTVNFAGNFTTAATRTAVSFSHRKIPPPFAPR